MGHGANGGVLTFRAEAAHFAQVYDETSWRVSQSLGRGTRFLVEFPVTSPAQHDEVVDVVLPAPCHGSAVVDLQEAGLRAAGVLAAHAGTLEGQAAQARRDDAAALAVGGLDGGVAMGGGEQGIRGRGLRVADRESGLATLGTAEEHDQVRRWGDVVACG